MSKKFITLTTLTAVILSIISYNAYALTNSMSASVKFATAISFANSTNANFGIVTAGQANTYTMDTTGAITVSGAGTGVTLGGTVTVASVDITGSTTQTMNITLNNAAADGGVSLALANATCDYDAGSVSNTCNNAAFDSITPGAGKALLIGLEIVADGTQTDNQTKTPTFDLVAVYN
jgi:hypothetical protein